MIVPSLGDGRFSLVPGIALFVGSLQECVNSVIGTRYLLAYNGYAPAVEIIKGVYSGSIWLANLPVLILMARSRLPRGAVMQDWLSNSILLAAAYASALPFAMSATVNDILLPYALWIIALWILCLGAMVLSFEKWRLRRHTSLSASSTQNDNPVAGDVK